MKNNSESYLSSKEVRKHLKVSGCDLMHLRESGKVEYIKKGNAYLYLKNSINSMGK